MDQNKKQSWLDPVSVNKVEEYIKSKFTDACDIEIFAKNKRFIAVFTIAESPFDEEDFSIMLEEFTTSIKGHEIDKDWINIVRECNECREIDGWTYDQDLVRSLEIMIYDKKRASIKKAEDEYKTDVEFLNNLFDVLNIEEEIEPRQI